MVHAVKLADVLRAILAFDSLHDKIGGLDARPLAW
jgi:hypothetical protein